MTPLMLHMILAHHRNSEPQQFFTPMSWHSVASKAARAHLVNEGMLVRAENNETIPTKNLDFFVEHLLKQPLPVEYYRIPEDE